ncbi:zinc-binding metallopeptidase family protein [Novosphingobium resinovorum]|uniref:zinc-binding metallopeptidase family protein n=1 Tax=Novosphingobium resinovorum TaxID=158500 RepID=UPI002ED4072D|nr:putative zinc-binding metallopeptidase [Novosphingobium resinovorum]
MRAFPCPNCRRLNHFEVRVCPGCQATLGYDPAIDGFRFLADDATVWRDGEGAVAEVVVCANNNDFQICNWLVATGETTPMCRACRHNRTIPDLSEPSVPPRWGRIEAAKRRLFHTLMKLGLPLETKAEEGAGRTGGAQGLAFDFLYDAAAEQAGNPQIYTGHDGGVITLNLIEADDAERERMRNAMGEPYRTLLGHFRHEVGHHYWSRLVETDPAELEAFRAVFGDERIDYAQALQAHYADDGSKVWTDAYVSFYATSHPWEDFAETFAHYLHIVDVLATAGGFDLSLAPLPGDEAGLEVELDFDPYSAGTAALAEAMAPLSFAMNAVNRSMGQPDLYPFHLSDAIVAKLDYVRGLAAKARGGARGAARAAEPAMV